VEDNDGVAWRGVAWRGVAWRLLCSAVRSSQIRISVDARWLAMAMAIAMAMDQHRLYFVTKINNISY